MKMQRLEEVAAVIMYSFYGMVIFERSTQCIEVGIQTHIFRK
jgi:hypothetical protein